MTPSPLARYLNTSGAGECAALCYWKVLIWVKTSLVPSGPQSLLSGVEACNGGQVTDPGDAPVPWACSESAKSAFLRDTAGELVLG